MRSVLYKGGGAALRTDCVGDVGDQGTARLVHGRCAARGGDCYGRVDVQRVRATGQNRLLAKNQDRIKGEVLVGDTTTVEFSEGY